MSGKLQTIQNCQLGGQGPGQILTSDGPLSICYLQVTAPRRPKFGTNGKRCRVIKGGGSCRGHSLELI